ncbi:MAG: FKBP-type peptidyl-prolyl cis-trans isomerase [Verrucomicrobia bacterium]|jgi:FKBP-type peptidyl-prolyl cis-trans isomerase FklB|nr:FKBP-type peptidyl-prolyl cis-trans isomerase [Verrucomicrobiota bacterium]
MKHKIALLLSLVLPTACLQAQTDSPPLTSQKDKVSYAIGYNIGMNLKNQQYDVDPNIIARGIKDLLSGTEPAMTETEARQALQEYQQALFQKHQEEMAAAAAKNKEEGQAWLAENATKEGVVTLESGLQYKVLASGDGESAGPNDTVKVNYRGTLIDGTVFDSSYDRGQPAQFRVTGVIKGWTEALQLMKQGDKWQLFIPSDLAYGDRPQGDKIKPGSTLIFEVELLEVTKPQPITSDIIKVPSAEEMKKGAKIETIKADDLKRLEEEARKAKTND